jgi:RNA polymerase sigma-70 factor (sigma-E family)
VVVSDAGATRQEFEAFFERHYRELSRLAYLVTGDHAAADDVTGDALLSAWQHWERVQSSDQPIAYVRRIVLNLAASRVRRRVRERRGLVMLLPAVNHHAPASDLAAVIDVRAALLALPPRRRACVVLRYAFDLSEEEVSRTLNISVGTVKSQTSKGAVQLRKMLGEFMPGGRKSGPRAPAATPEGDDGLAAPPGDATPGRYPAGLSMALVLDTQIGEGPGWSR